MDQLENDIPMVTYRGKWIYTPGQTILNNGYIVCADDKIHQVTQNRPDGKIVEYDGLICPGR
ncbi:MAG: hypothetical protein VX438_14390 [Planctomycetota bacterium]|nr:hypothetical protein [Planctomycetota bacterium]